MLDDAKPPWTRWSSAALPERQRFDAWNEALRATHLAWSLKRDTRSPGFSAELERHEVGPIRVVRCACDPLEGERTRAEIARGNDELYGIVLVREGTEAIRVAGETRVLGAGSFALWDSERDVSFAVTTRLEKVSLFVKKADLRGVIADPERHLGRVVSAANGAAALAAAHLVALATQARTLAAAPATRVLAGTLDLFGAAFGEAAPASVPARSARLAQIRAWISARLEDAQLTPRRIAAAHGMSVRTLHAWFHDEGTSLSRWMLRERLERSRADLMRGDGSRVTDIAFRWGFNDAAYFSRAFRRRFGRAPSALARGKAALPGPADA